MAETLGNYLLDELYRRGVEHLFGVPGDYVLRFNKTTEAHPMQFINATRENTAGYMADAYARVRGLGAVCTTYGVGLNIVNSISQAYVENSPVVLISGAPGQKELDNSPFLHHLIPKKENARGINTQLEILSKITVAQTCLTDPLTAPAEIQRVLNEAVWQKRPVYIEFPRDLVLRELQATSFPPIYPPQGDPALLKQKLNATKALFENAKHPLIWVGHEVMRLKIADQILRFAEKWQIPIATSLLGKSAFDENHPLVLGVYQGEMSRPEVVKYVNQTDGLLMLGLIQTDVDTGLFTTSFEATPKFSVKLDSNLLKEFVYQIFNLDIKKEKNPLPNKQSPTAHSQPSSEKITIQKALDTLQEKISNDHLLISDVGDCLFGASDLVVPQNSYFSNAYFESLGFAVPGAIGLAIAQKNKRVIALVGDGAFQMTGIELSTALRYSLDPIVILFNNQGYGTERPLIEGNFNDIVNWNYSQLPALLGGGIAVRVETCGQFAQALSDALETRGTYTLIEIVMDKLDFSNAAKRFSQVAQALVRKNSG
ncbi:MAG: alpha-keto acid decarboxylase family protein [Parachlamydiaceae bacterium]